MKKLLYYTIMVFLILTVLAGCTNTQQTGIENSPDKKAVQSENFSEDTSVSDAAPSTAMGKGMLNENDYAYIDPDDIDWIKMQGGFHINTKILLPGHDDEKISRIVTLINSGTDKVESTKTEVNVIHSRARPVGIYFHLKNGNKVYIWPSYMTKTYENGWSAAPVEDKFVLNIENNEKDEYYTILSKDVAKYLRDGWKDDMPVVKEIEVSSESCKDGEKGVIREGDKAFVSGDGCTAKEVTIHISRAGNPREDYVVGKVSPEFGQWEWKCTITRQLKTVDGKEVNLEKDLYDINAYYGKGHIGACGVIDFRE